MMPALDTPPAAPGLYWAPTKDLILDAVMRHFGWGPRAVCGRCRAPRELIEARFAAWWLARHHTCWSVPQIGRRIGARDHTTVLSGIRRAGEIHAASRDFARALDAASATLKEAFHAD